MICRKAHVMLPEANFPFPGATFPSSRAQNRGFCALVLRNMASGNRKARKFLFLHAFKLLLPVGHCLQSTWAPGTWAPGTWAPGTGAPWPWNRGTGAPWRRGTVASWNCLPGNCSPSRAQYCYAHIGLM